jgi:hypothetical protein
MITSSIADFELIREYWDFGLEVRREVLLSHPSGAWMGHPAWLAGMRRVASRSHLGLSRGPARICRPNPGVDDVTLLAIQHSG